jgi:hypothetical protein
VSYCRRSFRYHIILSAARLAVDYKPVKQLKTAGGWTDHPEDTALEDSRRLRIQRDRNIGKKILRL